MPSNRDRALQELVTRLAFLTRANGYSSDCGLDILDGEIPERSPDDPAEVLAVVAQDESQTTEDQGRISYTLPVEVIGQVAYVDGGPSPRELIEALIRDIKVAVEIEGNDQNATPASIVRSLDGTQPTGLSRGPTRVFPRVGGSKYVGASITYYLSFSELWGRPEVTP